MKATISKKNMQTIQKLKKEIFMLRDALSRTEIADIITLQSRLRSSNSTIQRLRQVNMELKDRVQLLEERLHGALTVYTTSNGRKNDLNMNLVASSVYTMKRSISSEEINGVDDDTFEDAQGDPFYDNDDDLSQQSTKSISSRSSTGNSIANSVYGSSSVKVSRPNSISALVTTMSRKPDDLILNLRKKNRHLEKLVLAYEERISFLEVNYFQNRLLFLYEADHLND
jgi:uncharacterized protein YdcH (DUF465 family)